MKSTTSLHIAASIVLVGTLAMLNFASASDVKAGSQATHNTRPAVATAQTGDLAVKYRSLCNQILSDLPGRLDSTKWDSVIEGARQAQETIDELKKKTAAIEEFWKKSGEDSQNVISRIEDLARTFETLAERARRQGLGSNGHPLPTSLAPISNREVDVYLQAAEAARETAKHVAATYEEVSAGMEKVRHAGPVLDRMKIAAMSFEELGELAGAADVTRSALAGIAVELNLILDQLDDLGRKTLDAATAMEDPAKPHRDGKPGTNKSEGRSNRSTPISRRTATDPVSTRMHRPSPSIHSGPAVRLGLAKLG